VFINIIGMYFLFLDNTAWVRARLCKLQNKLHSTRSRKW